MAFDSAGNLFVSLAETKSRILKFTPSGEQTLFASELTRAEGLAFDAADNLYVDYPDTHSVLKFAPDGTRTTFASGILHARALAYGSSGNIFVADVEGHAIYEINPSGVKTVVATTTGTGPRGLAFNGPDLFATGDESIVKFEGGTLPATIIGMIPGGAGQLAVEPPRIANISTRGAVQRGAGALIGGFVLAGTEPKTILVRALGPSLAQTGVPNQLMNPVLELHDGIGALVTSNDNWQQAGNAFQIPAGLEPRGKLESAILITLPPGLYTAVEAGKNSSSGVALLEIHDLGPNSDSRIENVATRGLVQTGSHVLIAGFILDAGSGRREVLVRALGPSLAQSEILDPLSDPTLALVDGNGALIVFNDGLKSSQQTEIEATALAPRNDLESAILTRLVAGNYTAVVAGQNGQTGVGIVEVYATR